MTLYEAVQVAGNLFAEGRTAECGKLCSEILAIQKTNPDALSLMGKLSVAAGDPDRAATFFIDAAVVFPFNEELVSNALLAAEKIGTRSEAERLIMAARSTIPGFSNKSSLERVKNRLGEFVVPTYPDNDVITQCIVAGRVFEPEIVAVAQAKIAPGTVALDLGANFGQMSILFSRMVGATGKVYAFEADDYIHHVLTCNLALNGATNVTTFMRAVHERDDQTVFFPDQDFVEHPTYGSYGIRSDAMSGRPVRTLTIDSLNIVEPISFMKVDVQGCDLFAMRGAIDTIRRHRMPIVFEYEERLQESFGTTFDDYVTFVREIDYRFERTVNNINFVIVPR